MKVRIHFGRGHRVERSRGGKNRDVALAMGALLTPGSVMATSLGLWRIAADLKWTEEFAISKGPFSHWQVWIASAAALQLCSRRLSRYGREKDTTPS